MSVLACRRIGIGALGLTASAAIAAPLALPIAPLLPAKEGQSTCYAADFDGSKALALGFHHEMPSPAPVTHMSARFHYPEGEEPYRDEMTGRAYDWRYTGYVSVTVAGRDRVLTAPTICEWRRHWSKALEPWLGCYLECDGGGIEFLRVPGRRAVDVVWLSGEHLRMSSCGGGGEILRGGASTKVFRLTEAPDSACKGAGE